MFCKFCSIFPFGTLPILFKSKCVLQVLFYAYIRYLDNTIKEQMYSACTLPIPLQSKCVLHVRCQYLYRANVFCMHVADTITEQMFSACTLPKLLKRKCILRVRCQYRYRANVFARTLSIPLQSKCILHARCQYFYRAMCSACTLPIPLQSIFFFFFACTLPILLQSKCVLQVLFYTCIRYLDNTIKEQMYSACTCSQDSVLNLHSVRVKTVTKQTYSACSLPIP